MPRYSIEASGVHPFRPEKNFENQHLFSPDLSAADTLPKLVDASGRKHSAIAQERSREVRARVARDVADSIHPHPTLSETLMEGSEMALGAATHMAKPRRKEK